MALSVKNEEADRLARKLADTTGESITQAVLVAIRERLEREEHRVGVSERLARLATELTAYPVIDDRSPDEILGYDSSGIPT